VSASDAGNAAVPTAAIPAPTAPDRIRLAPGLEIARVVTGLWQIADQERRDGEWELDSAARAMQPYLDAGFATLDMADHYGQAELIAGAIVRRSPSVELLTKWVPEPGAVSREDVVAAVDRARSRLGTPAVDLMQYHAWNYADPSWLDALFFLAELREAGTVREVGVTNFDAVHLDMAVRSGIPVVSNQVSFSLLDRRAAGPLANACRTHGVKLLAYGSLAGGFLTDRWLGKPEPVLDESLTWSQMKYLRFIREAGGWNPLQSVLRAARRVADRLGVSIANVACRYVLDHPAVAAVVVGARPGENCHTADNLRLFSFSLGQEAREELDEAAAGLVPHPGDCGDEYRTPPFLTATGDLSHHVRDGFPAPYPVRREGGALHVSTGTRWEEVAGYSRAVRRGRRILVSGTTASHRERLIGGSDATAQTHFVIDKIEGALQSLGATLADVVRTRVYTRRDADADAVSQVQGARFGAVSPVNTLVQAGLVGDELLVEVEAEAEANTNTADSR